MILAAVFFSGLLASGCLGWAAAGYIPQEEVSTVEIGEDTVLVGGMPVGDLYGKQTEFSSWIHRPLRAWTGWSTIRRQSGKIRRLYRRDQPGRGQRKGRPDPGSEKSDRQGRGADSAQGG